MKDILENHNLNAENHYELLMLNTDASPAEIKKSYRKLAAYYHPDSNPWLADNPEMEELFKKTYNRITEVGTILTNPETKELYDLTLVEKAKQLKQSSIFTTGMDESIVKKTKRVGSIDGTNLEITHTLSFADTLQPSRIVVRARQKHYCITCYGKGEVIPNNVAVCKTCRGRRQIRIEKAGREVDLTCPDCANSIASTVPCTQCEGKGSTIKIDRIMVDVKPGLTTGNRLVIKGRGNPGLLDGDDGDLIVNLEVEELEGMEVKGFDIIADLNLNYTQLIQGGRFTFETPIEEVKVVVEKGTRPNDTIVIEGKGVPRIETSGYGNLILNVRLNMPLSTDELISKLKEIGV